MNRIRRWFSFFLATGACATLIAPAKGQAPVFLHVDLDTSALVGLPSPPAPFYLDFQLLDGSLTLDAVNTVKIENFQFGGGMPSGTPLPTGDAVGDLSSTVTLQDDFSTFNDFVQPFVPGNRLSFDAVLTTNVDAGGTPDEFSFAILQQANNFFGFAEIPTEGPGDALLTVDLDGPIPTLNTYGSDLTRTDIALPAPVALFVPGPGVSTLLASLALCGACLSPLLRRRI
ncbi:MAG TPA: hypothetical protein VFB38_23740 [Chthonomonadaceae bacterium]|nr:hypothetical protein [Chthonomonadaceae bacterium]